MKKKLLLIKKEYLIGGLIILLGIFLFLREEEIRIIQNEREVPRNEYLGSDKSVYVDATVEGVEYENFEIEVSAQRYTDEQLEGMYYDCLKVVLGLEDPLSESFRVESDRLYIPKEAEGYPFDISWEPSDDCVISPNGDITAASEINTEIILTLEYGEWSKEVPVKVWISPTKETTDRYIRYKLAEEIVKADEQGINTDKVVLPDSVGGLQVSYTDPKSKKNPWYLLMGVIVAGFVIVATKYDKQKEVTKKREEIISDYPIMIQKMVLYISAGMTVRNVWSRLCDQARRNGSISRPLYAEMEITENEMKTGVSERIAYDHFGERIGDNDIIRFTALLSQNLKRGSTSLGDLLSEESNKAFTLRKNRALKKGEEAGTRLLLPMMLLMLVVLLVIMIPAFRSL